MTALTVARRLFSRQDIRGVDAPLGSATTEGVVPRSSLGYEVWNPGDDTSAYKLVEPGDFVIGLRSFQHGLSYSDVRVKVSPAYTVLRLIDKSQFEPRFYRHFFRSAAFVSLLGELGQGIRQGKVIDFNTFAEINVPTPPLEEQRRIADFLDDQVAHIDNVIAARLRQKELLGTLATEMIRNVIQQPHAALVPLSAVVGWIEGPGILAKDFREEGVPILRIAHLRSVPPSLEGCDFVDEAEARGRWRHFLTEIGELIVSGSATVGELAVWVTEEIRDAIPYTGLIKLRPRSGLEPGYMRAFFISRVFGEQIDLLKSGIGIQHWGPTHLSQVRIPVPPATIQREVAAEVARVEAYVSAGVDLIDRLLGGLDTLKHSLITAAVTGELDVSAADGSRVPA